VSTPGSLFEVTGVGVCETLELPWNGGDNHTGKSCILPGRYRIVPYFSPHLRHEVLAVLDVPGRTEIEIHNANTPNQLLGCIAVGRVAKENAVYESVAALDDLLRRVHASPDAVWLIVENPK
jgi:hypothetical protein